MKLVRLSLACAAFAFGSCGGPRERPVSEPAAPNSTPDSEPTTAAAIEAVFRSPFTLTLHVDDEHYYEEEFGAVPYAHDGFVYLFKGDHFGIRFDEKDQPIYAPNAQAADLEFEFSQGIEGHPEAMLLVITNHSNRKASMAALMTVPERKDVQETSILDILPGLKDYESWPHPIVQLVLRDLHLESAAKSNP